MSPWPVRSAAVLAGVLVAAPAMAQPHTMDELWPNEDGRSWTYAQHYEDYQTPRVVDNHMKLFFDGTVTVPVDIQTQYLREVLVGGTPGLAPAAATDGPAQQWILTDPFLRQLWTARPDLRTKIRQVVADAACPPNAPAGSYGYFISGELMYRKTADEIAAWRCDVSNTRAWL
jgi:hypothetical protein